MAGDRIDKLYNALKADGTSVPSRDIFRRNMLAPGKTGYNNRLQFFKAMKADGADVGNTYEDFAKSLGLHAVGTPTVNKYRQQLFNSVDPNKSRASELTHRAVNTAHKAMDNVRKPVRGAVVNKQGKKVDEFDITPAKTLDDLNREYAQEVASDWEKEQQRQSLYNTTRSLDEVQRKIAERDAQLDEADNGFWTGIRHAAQGMNVTGGMFQQYDDDMRKELIDPKYKQYLVEANYLTQMKKQLIQEEEDAAAPNATKWDRFKHASSSFTSGMVDEAFGSDAFDFGGYNKMRESDVLLRINDRINRGVATDDDRRLLQILKDKEEVESRLDNDAYSFGRGASQSAGFVTDFLITGGGDFGGLGRLGGKMALGLARKTFAKTMTKDLGKRFAAWSLKNLGKTLGEATGAAMTATSVQIGKTAGNATQRYLGLDSDDGGLEYDKDGNLKFKGGTDVGTAIAKAIASGTIENYTELLGPHITSMGKRLFGWGGVGLEKITPDALSKFFDKVGSSELFKRIGTFTDEVANSKVLNAGKKALAKVGVNDMPEEGLEEEAGIILNSLITGDNKFSDLWDKETQYKTWGGVMSMIGAMRAIPIARAAVGGTYSATKNKVEYFECKHNLTKAETLARQALGDKWTPIKELIDNADNKHIIEVGVNIIRQSDKYSQEQAKAAQNYIGQLLKMRGFNNATMASIRDKNAKGEEQTDADKKDIEVSNAYAEGHEAEGELRHQIQLEYEKRKANLAKRIGLTPEKIEAMNDASFSSYSGLYSDADFDIFQYKKAKAAYDGVMDNAQNLVDIAGEVAAQRVDNMTNVHDGTIRKAFKKGTEMNPDSPVYIISGNIELNDDGSINYANSDKMIVIYDEETGQREAIGNFMLASVDPNMQNAEEVKAQAIIEAKQKIITEQSNVIDGILVEGSEFSMEGADGITHNYNIVQVDEQGNCIVSVDGTVLPEPLSLEAIQQQYDQSNVARSVKNDQTAQEPEQTQQESQPIEDKFDYSKIANQNDGKVKSVVVTDEEGKNRFPNAKAVFLIQDKGAMPKFVVMDEEGNLTSYVGKRGDKIHLNDEKTVGEYKKQRQEELQKIAAENANSSMIEGNSGENRGEIEAEPIGTGAFGNIYNQFKGKVKEAFSFLMSHKSGDLLGVFHRDDVGDIDLVWGNEKMGLAHILGKHVGEGKDFETPDDAIAMIENVINSGRVFQDNENRYTLMLDGVGVGIRKSFDGERKNWVVTAVDFNRSQEEKGIVTNPTSTSHGVTEPESAAALNDSKSKDINNSSNGNENNESLTFEDGTPIPVDENGEVDLSQTDAAHAAEWYDTNLGEDADDWLDGEIKKAKKVLEQAQNKKLTGTKPSELVASKKEKEAAIADAQARYDSAISIRDSLKERRIAKEENTPEGRKSLIEKARRKYARLKNSEEWSERTGDLWNETVGKLLHRLYDATGIDVFNDTPNTVYEYVAANVGPYSLNYEGNDNSKGVQQETGLSRSDFAKLGWLSAEGKGMTIDAKVHRLWENRPSNLESADTQEIRNALISLITSGQTAFQARDYILNQRIELAESALEEQLRQEEDAAEAQKAKEEEEKKKAELGKKKAEEEKTNENRNAPELSHEQQKAMEEGEKLGFPAFDKEGEPINQNVIELANWAKEQGLEIDPTSKLNSYADLYVMCKGGFGVSTLVPDVGEDINQVFYFPDNVQGEQLAKLQEEFNVGRDLKHSADMNSELTEGAMFYDGDTAREFKEFVDKKVEMQNKVFGEQRPEEDLPFSAKDNGQQQTTSERDADVERNKVDDMKVVDNIVGQKTRKTLEKIAKMMGANVQWQYSDKNANGWFDDKTNTIYLTLDSSITEGVQFIFGHEMTHEMKTKDTAAYDELKTLVKDMMGEDAFNSETDRITSLYNENNVFYNGGRAAYEEEVVADQLGKWIRDANYAHTLLLKMSHPLLAKLHEIVNKFLMALRGIEISDDMNLILRSIEQAYVKTAKGQVTNSETGEDVSFSLRLKSAIEDTETNPSDAQKESGNYKKGHIKFGGYDYTIENPKGSTRSGKDANGKDWKVTMHDTYGYIRGKFGKDGDHLDMFINDKADLDNWNGDVFVVDQVNPDGSFDEHKVMYGYDSMNDAEKAYLANYGKGWQGLGNITGASKTEFDKWLDTSNRKLKPFADYAKVKFSQAQSVDNEEPKTFEEFLNHPSLKFSIKNEEQRKAAEDAYEYAAKLRPNKYAQYAIVDMGMPSKIPEYYEKKVLADNWRRFYNGAVRWGNYKLFDLDRPFADQVNEVKGKVPDKFNAPDKVTNKDNIKGLDRQVSSAAEPHYSLKDEKTLAGVHNITEEKLLKAIKQGGLANPSVAVIDFSKQNHEGYGDISLILPSDKVAKRTGKNAGTWQGDAWTPTYPQVERQMSNKGAAKASKDVSSVPGDMYREARRGLDRWLDGGEANSAMAYMFLHEKGVAPEPKKIQHKFGDDVYNELKLITAGDFNIYGIGKADAQKVLDMYIDAKFDGDKDLYEEKTKAWLERNKSIVDAGNKGGMRYTIAKENVKLYDEYGFNYKGVQTFVRDVEYDHRKTGVDMNATLNEVEDYIKTNNLTDEFDTWLEGKGKEYGIKEVIFDGFTPSGNRRYVPNTLENVSKIMKKQGRNGATGISVSFQNFAASLMPSYGTLKDIRSKKGLLTSDYEDLDKFNEKWSKVFFELGMKCQPDATGTFDDYGLARLSEAAKTSDPQAYLKKEYNVDFSDEDTKRLKEMVKAIKEESPAMYFETKFERPVGFNEFSSAVVPTTASDEVKQALQNAGVQIYEYDKEKEGDRSRAFNEAVNSSDNIKFSLKSMMAKPEGWKQANKKTIHIAEAIERDPKFSLKKLDGTLIKAGTYFSGGGLVEEGLKGIIDPVVAVEYDEKISGVYRNNFGQHIVTADVRDVDPKELVKQIDGEVEYFHASPVCKNYSQAKSNHAEVELDKETAASTADFINAVKPKVVTIENVKGYKDSEAMKTITDALDANGYTWDADVYNAADYGGYTNRERLIVRAVRDGKLPEKPKKMERKSGWYEAVADIIPTLTEKKNGVAPWMDIRLKADGIDWRNIDKPLYVMGSAYADGKIPHAFADELLPTLRTKSGDVIVMPDGKVYRAMGRVLARVSGVSDDYKMPFSENLSHTIIGNGIPTQLTEHVIAPLLQNTLRPTTPEDGNTKFSLRGSTPYDKQMEEWMEKNHLEKGAVPMEKPIMKEGENIFDYANRMVEWTRNQNLWKTAPKQTGFQDALDKWKADNGLSPDAYPPVRPHREYYSSEIGYAEDLEEYNKKKELWKSAPKPKDFDLSVDLEDMNKQLRNIRRAVLNQKNYDQRTVKAVSDLVRKMLNIGWGDGLSRGKVGNLLSAAKNATGANDVKKYLDKAMGILAENYLNRLSTAYDNLINTKGARADQSGVIKMGSLDADGQAFMSEYKKAINMDDSSLNTYIANIEEDSAKNEDNVEMNDYRLAGIQAAIMFKQQIGGNDADIAELQRQIGELKNKKDATKEDKDLLKSLEKKLFENKFDRITMYENLLNNIQRMVKESKGRAKEFREEIAEHKNEILHRANLDLEGVDSTYYDTTTAKKKFVNNVFQRAAFSSTYTFEQFLKFFGKKAANGEGYLYNYFTKLNQDALDEEQLYNEMNRNAIDEKTKELFGKKKFMELVGIDGNGMKEMDIEVTDYSNKKTGKRTIHLKQGQMLYIYLVNKETDGEMKLRAMGITEEDVAAIEENLDPRVKAMGEWLQNEYLPECQRRYQATHTKYFGAPMKEVENYFPLAINNRARNVKEDVNQDSDAMSQLAGTSTGAIVTRRVNVIPLDIENADAFEVAFNHLQEMEEWSAMLPFRQDINTLLSYTHFRNQVQNMSSVAYGSGKTLWDEFKQTAQIAAGTYKPKVNAGMMDSRIAAAMGGVAVAKISGRLWTAIKQSQSATVFLPECDFTRFVKNGVNPYGSWKWAMENIPDFRKRVENMTYGDVKLRQYLDELEKYHDWTKVISKLGMAPNILVDGVTCAVGARSVYETEVNRLTKLGYPKEKAEEKAYYKAVAAYNKTQQSSGGMYLSPMQVDRTYVSAALSLFKNANFAYGRMQIEACRGLARTYDFWGGKHKTALIESMTRQIMEEDGLDENTARAIAKATYNRTFRQSIGRLINFATLVPISWALYKVLPYLLTGDDDDKKTDMIEEAVLKGFATSLSDNYVIPFASNILNAGLKVEDGKPTFDPEVFRYQNLYINPATSDLANIYSMIGNQKWYSVVNKFGMLGVQSLIGFNPETVGALYQAFAEADKDNGNTAKEWQIGILKAISAPEESIRELYMDELGLKSGNIKKIPLAELEKRYAERQINRDNLLSQIFMDAESFNGYVDKYQKSFEKKIKDKMDKWDEYDKKKADEFFDTTTDPKLKDMIAKKRVKDANAAADEQIAKEGLDQEKKGKEPYETAYDAVKMSIDVAEDNAISTYNKVLNKRYAALNDEYNNQTDAMKYIFMSSHPNFKAYKDIKSEYTNYGKKMKELKEKLVSADGYDAKQTILKQIRTEREKFSELQSKVR